MRRKGGLSQLAADPSLTGLPTDLEELTCKDLEEDTKLDAVRSQPVEINSLLDAFSSVLFKSDSSTI